MSLSILVAFAGWSAFGQAVPPLPAPAIAQISLENVTIASAVARFNNVNRTKIVIEDAGIGAIRIVGLFSAHDPDQFARAAAIVAGARVGSGLHPA